MTGRELRKICMALSMNLHSDYHRFTEMTVEELMDVCEDYREMVKKSRESI